MLLTLINNIGLTASFFLLATASTLSVYFVFWLISVPFHRKPETAEERYERIRYGL